MVVKRTDTGHYNLELNPLENHQTNLNSKKPSDLKIHKATKNLFQRIYSSIKSLLSWAWKVVTYVPNSISYLFSSRVTSKETVAMIKDPVKTKKQLIQSTITSDKLSLSPAATSSQSNQLNLETTTDIETSFCSSYQARSDVLLEVLDDMKIEVRFLTRIFGSLKLTTLKDLEAFQNIEVSINQNHNEIALFEKIAAKSEFADGERNNIQQSIVELKQAYHSLSNRFHEMETEKSKEISHLKKAQDLMSILRRSINQVPPVELASPEGLQHHLLEFPTLFRNTENRCWMHSSLQVLFAAGLNTTGEGAIPEAIERIKNVQNEGNTQTLDAASRHMHRTLCNPDLPDAHFALVENPLSQKDAAEFFEATLPKLGYSFKFEITRKGTEIPLTSTSRDKGVVLNVHLREGVRNFQDLLDHEFSPQLINQSQSAWCPDGINVPERLETQRILVNEDEEAPEVFFVRIVRFIQKSDEQITLERAQREDDIAAGIIEYKKLGLIEDQETARIILEYETPEVSQLGKDLSPISLPENYQIDFSKAFGSENPKPYQLVGVVTQNGDLNSGHYTADVKRRGQWYHCDDMGRKVQPIDREQVRVNSGNEYILAFSKTS